MTYWLEFSGDGGVDWTTLAFDLSTPEFTVDAGTLPGTTNGYFQVTASDGFHYATAETGPITLPPQPPNVEIDTPLGGAVYLTNSPILLHASASGTRRWRLAGCTVPMERQPQRQLGYRQ